MLNIKKTSLGNYCIYGEHEGVNYNEVYIFYNKNQAIKQFRGKYNLKGAKLNIKVTR